MPRPPNPLPDALPDVFTVAEAPALGIRLDRLQQEDLLWFAPGVYARLGTRGASTGATVTRAITGTADGRFEFAAVTAVGARQIYSSPADSHPAEQWRESQCQRARLLSMKLAPGQFFTHYTAAALWGLPVPARTDPRLALGVFQPARGSRSRAFHAHRLTPGNVKVVVHDGVPLLSPASTWVVLAGELGRAQAVALGDAVIHNPRIPGTNRLKREPLATLDEVARLVAQPFRRNRRLLDQYLKLLSPHAASPPESRLRLLLHDWGLPTPELDYDVYATDVRDNSGQFLGCSEFAFPEYRLALEYEGDHHRTDPRQWERDIEKYREYANAGWEVLRVTRGLLYRDPETLRHEIAAALARRGPLPTTQAESPKSRTI